MDTDESCAVATLLSWVLDLTSAGAATANASEKAARTGRRGRRCYSPTPQASRSLSGRTVQKHWRTVLGSEDHGYDPEDCYACGRTHDTRPFHQEVERGVVLASEWLVERFRTAPDREITSKNAADVALEMTTTE